MGHHDAAHVLARRGGFAVHEATVGAAETGESPAAPDIQHRVGGPFGQGLRVVCRMGPAGRAIARAVRSGAAWQA